MLVLRAKTAGFCMGVSLALHKLDSALKKNSTEKIQKTICTFGPIIHNPQVLNEYEQKGIRCILEPTEVKSGNVILIRAHGITRKEEASLCACGADIIDATCPRVKKAQLAIAEATKDGSSLLLFGDADHPEVRGLISYANNESFVFASIEALNKLSLDPQKSWVLASQTTQDASVFAQINNLLQQKLPRLTLLSTICDATGERQAEARSIALNVEAMVVVGGRQSGNTRRLAELAAERGIPTWHVEKVDELNPQDFTHFRSIGLTAGASTPKRLIDEAEEWLTKL